MQLLTYKDQDFYIKTHLLINMHTLIPRMQVAQWLERSTEMLKIAGSIALRAGDFSVAI